MKHYELKTIETDLVEFWKNKVKEYSTDDLDLTDDDTISDYMYSNYKDKFNLTSDEFLKMKRIIIADWFIQNKAFTPYKYNVIEYKEVAVEINNK